MIELLGFLNIRGSTIINTVWGDIEGDIADQADLDQRLKDNLQAVEDAVTRLTPSIGSNGNWYVNEVDSGVKAQGDQGIPGTPGADAPIPTIGLNGNWWVGSIDTGKPARGEKGDAGQNGISPVLTIGMNGNWYINGADTGTPARGETGPMPTITIGGNGNWFIDGVDTLQPSRGPPGSAGSGADWSEITNIPNSFPPSSHNHVKADVTDFAHTHPENVTIAQPTGNVGDVLTKQSNGNLALQAPAAGGGDVSSTVPLYGTTAIAAATVAKTTTIAGITSSTLKAGQRIFVRFTLGSTSATMSINVSSIGAKNVYFEGATATPAIPVDATVEFIYDGTNWIMGSLTSFRRTLQNLVPDMAYGTVASGTSSVTCAIAAITAASLYQGQVIAIEFTNGWTYTTMSLNVSSTGAKSVKFKGSTTLPSIAKGAVAMFVYDGVDWLFMGTVQHLIPNAFASQTNSVNTVARAVTVSGIYANTLLCPGQIVYLKFTYGHNVATMTLNVSGTGIKDVRYQGSTVTPEIPANTEVALMYDGTYWNIIGSTAIIQKPSTLSVERTYMYDQNELKKITSPELKTMNLVASEGIPVSEIIPGAIPIRNIEDFLRIGSSAMFPSNRNYDCKEIDISLMIARRKTKIKWEHSGTTLTLTIVDTDSTATNYEFEVDGVKQQVTGNNKPTVIFNNVKALPDSPNYSIDQEIDTITVFIRSTNGTKFRFLHTVDYEIPEIEILAPTSGDDFDGKRPYITGDVHNLYLTGLRLTDRPLFSSSTYYLPKFFDCNVTANLIYESPVNNTNIGILSEFVRESKNCYCSGTIYVLETSGSASKTWYIGGLFGQSHAYSTKIVSCLNNVGYMGDDFGYALGVKVIVYNTAATVHIGGILGRHGGKQGQNITRIARCDSIYLQVITNAATKIIGGIVGSGDANCFISGCAAIMSASLSGSDIAAIIGQSNGSSLINCAAPAAPLYNGTALLDSQSGDTVSPALSSAQLTGVKPYLTPYFGSFNRPSKGYLTLLNDPSAVPPALVESMNIAASMEHTMVKGKFAYARSPKHNSIGIFDDFTPDEISWHGLDTQLIPQNFAVPVLEGSDAVMILDAADVGNAAYATQIRIGPGEIRTRKTMWPEYDPEPTALRAWRPIFARLTMNINGTNYTGMFFESREFGGDNVTQVFIAATGLFVRSGLDTQLNPISVAWTKLV